MSRRSPPGRISLACLLGLACLAFVGLELSAHAGRLSPLAPNPDWSALDAYQNTITRAEFSRLINQVYTPDGEFWKYIQIDDARAIIFSDLGHRQPLFTLHFAASDSTCAPPSLQI